MSLQLLESGPCDWPDMKSSADPPAAAPNGLSLLLARLHSDVEEAAREYERLRVRLVRFFEWRGAAAADECADETLDRLASKLENTEVQDVQKYVYGIARLVLLEHRRVVSPTSLEDASPAALAELATPPHEVAEPSLQDCFEQSLAELPDDSRRLLLQYYVGEGQTKIANRRQLAASLGLTDNALRSRMQRLRDGLERSVMTRAASLVDAVRR